MAFDSQTPYIPGCLRPRRRYRIFALACCLTVSLGASAGPARSGGLFDDTTVLEIQIRAPWGSILKSRRAPTNFLATLVYAESGGSPVSLDAQLRLSGDWRRRNCIYPPLQLRLNRRQIESTLFADQATLHATVACRPNSRFAEHVVQEHLVYRLFGLLTQYSLRTRLLRLEYWSTEANRRVATLDAFLIEDYDLAAQRLGRQRVEADSVHRARLDPAASALFAVFQFMIGHTDWSLLGSSSNGSGCCHNAVLIAREGTGSGFIPLPYDFDASGLVNAGYMAPAPQLKIQSVRQRLYRGFCDHNDELPEALAIAAARRRDVERLYTDAEALRPAARRRSLRYLDGFFDRLTDSEKLVGQMVATCRDK